MKFRHTCSVDGWLRSLVTLWLADWWKDNNCHASLYSNYYRTNCPGLPSWKTDWLTSFHIDLWCDYSLLYVTSAGNNSRSSDIVRPNFENVRPISHYDQTWWPNISPAHLELSSTRRCQSMFYVRPNLSNVRPKGRFERTYVLWIKKNYFQHCVTVSNC